VSVASVHSISWSSEKENASASHPAGVMVAKLWTPEDPRSLRTHQESSGGPFAQANWIIYHLYTSSTRKKKEWFVFVVVFIPIIPLYNSCEILHLFFFFQKSAISFWSHLVNLFLTSRKKNTKLSNITEPKDKISVCYTYVERQYVDDNWLCACKYNNI
jgi:hypothetical protein